METTQSTKIQYTAKDFKSDQYVRWCPGCGDYAVLNSLQKVMADLGVAPHDIAVISGIGCSSRLPYYTSSYGFHTIHGRGAAVATGVKVANPKLTVWQITGDGDCLAIGGNHFIHSVRRNVDLNVLLFNNQIYGLTKGQYSPTTKKGFVTKSSPFGTVERPFRPAELTFGARGTFFARLLDVDLKTSQQCMIAAAKHKGTSVVECLVNCVIFNDGAHGWLSEKETRTDRTIVLEDGKPMIFGKDRNKGLVLDGFNLKVVTIGENGVTENDILVHDAKCQDTTLHMKLAMMEGPEMPIALGVIRDVEEETYDEAVEAQIAEVQAKSKIKTFDELIATCEQWEM
ncbi:2-oxoglutarate synthase [Paludibacter propionicigenes WB4]|jgi:2-oxoglutarate/2-oxoacid ferredoxin oxidoreductase subunit beta|uniref:2-oxoglutarate synthase n=1 Tax=Paludibacter propionicigenes (strain DSM 17365 / JCM 13257 / WB4) TaxID=694427 RepID=E4T5S3_PALPW|nr:2-oxoacid:ferredoxin oxidoreductase subunit beta [Paludibacter propionicigenes]ADQ80067.1 2-oxoglutarate synthase [Paludibacter propionicigenes WB4]